MKSEERKAGKAWLVASFLFILPFFFPQLKGMPLLVSLSFSCLLVLLAGAGWGWVKKRFIPFLLSLATFTGFSLLLGASWEKLLQIDIRCAGVFFVFSSLTTRLSSSQLLGILSKEGKPSSLALFFYLVLRYLSLVREEGKKMIRAAQARGGEVKRLSWRAFKLFINYILRILERSERVAMAIEARGWEGTEEFSPTQEEIKVENLYFAYPNGREVLKNINLRIGKGEKVALLGANGAGKSTLLWVIGGVLKPKGRVEVCGMEVKRENLAKLRKILGMVFEDPDDQLLMPTLLEDVMFGLSNIGYSKEEARMLAVEVLKRFGLEGYERSHPQDLSQGEKRKASLAGVLVMNPRILLLDEPSSNLDAKGRRELKDILKGLDTTFVLATHDFELAKELCPRAIVLMDGEIVYDGAMDDLVKKEELLRRWGIL